MRLFHAAVVAAGFIIVPLAATALAGSPATRAPRAATASSPGESTSVVVIDVAAVFKGHERFKQRMEKLKHEREGFEKEFIQNKQAVLARGEQLSQHKSGSPEYKQIEARMARELADLRIKAVAKNGDLLEREGKIYYDTYQEIVAAVSQLAERYNLSLVVRYDSEATDPHDRGSILKAISRDVVYQRNLDITQLVIKQVNAAALVSAPPDDKVLASDQR